MIDPSIYIKNYFTSEIQSYQKDFKSKSPIFEGMRNALVNFERTGFPEPKNEDWKYTPITKLLVPTRIKNGPVAKADEETLQAFSLKEGFRIVFINGHFASDVSSLPKNVSVTHVSTKNFEGIRRDRLLDIVSLNPNSPFENLNVAALHEAYVIDIEPNQFVDTPISILHLTHDSAKEHTLNTRLVVKAKKYARATIMESFGHFGEGEPVYMTNSYTNFVLEEGAYIEHVKNNRESLNAVHIGKVKAEVAKSAYFNSFTFTTGGKTTRNEIEINLNDVEAIASVNGLFSIKENQHCDNFSDIHHNSEKTNSEQLFKGVASANGRGVFTGKITMHKYASECSSAQLSKNLLLSESAKITARPQLEIYNDDVKASHGATYGKINQEEMFYLGTRGIPKPKAEKMLCKAFARDALNKIKSELVKDKLSEALAYRLDTCLNCELRLCDAT